jgi:SAM-dependent methyltransferase
VLAPNDLPGVRVTGTTDTGCTACGNATGNLTVAIVADPLPDDSGPAAFDYVYCAACGTLHIIAPPADMTSYYGDGYYSHQSPSRGGYRGWLQRRRDAGAVFGGPGAALARLLPYVRLTQLRVLTSGQLGHRVTRNSRVLDVGCGDGGLLRRLAAIGFNDLTGCDPFMTAPDPSGNPRLLGTDIHAVDGVFDLIMCSHVLEHVVDPAADLDAMRARLAPGGMLMVRVPLVNEYAWNRFGGFWVQSDVPRHLTLWTPRGFVELARARKLDPVLTQFDAGPFMLLGSLARQRGVFPHHAGPEPDRVRAEIADDHGAEAYKIAKAANADGTSDQASFYLRAAP